MDYHDFLKWVSHNIPFLALMVGHPPENRPMLTRLLEQGVVGIIAAAAVLWANDKVQDNTLSSLKESSARLERRVDLIDNKVDMLQRDILIHSQSTSKGDHGKP